MDQNSTKRDYQYANRERLNKKRMEAQRAKKLAENPDWVPRPKRSPVRAPPGLSPEEYTEWRKARARQVSKERYENKREEILRLKRLRDAEKKGQHYCPLLQTTWEVFTEHSEIDATSSPEN